ncbi:phage head closure protein [Undibacterium sp. MH2W]|uniref:phage head closure protein n=1 Tax=Undibacterium sp. MH2W TaxID=3413044 RepID=UPI003BF2A0B5
MKKRVILQQQNSVDGTAGNPTTVWSTISPIWAEIEGLTAQQRMVSEAIHTQVSHKITVRYRSEFKNPVAVMSMRIVYGARIFNIQGMINFDERNQMVELSANEGMNDG